MTTKWERRVLYLGNDNSGIDVHYVKSRRILRIGGWYDGCAGIQSTETPLGEFLRGLGITQKDVDLAMRDERRVP